jgi:hypothetical protein
VTTTNSKVKATRDAMIARRAAAAGLSVEAYLAAGQAEADRTLAISRARCDRAHQRATITRGAGARGNTITWTRAA